MRRFKTFLASAHTCTSSNPYSHCKIGAQRDIYCVDFSSPSGLTIAALYSQDIKFDLGDGSLLRFTIQCNIELRDDCNTRFVPAIYSRVKGEGVWSSMVPILKEDGQVNTSPSKRLQRFEQIVYDKFEVLLPGKKETRKKSQVDVYKGTPSTLGIAASSSSVIQRYPSFENDSR